jgi:serine O-acetyltransferase
MRKLTCYLKKSRVFKEDESFWKKLVLTYFFGSSRRCVLLYRLGKYFYDNDHKLLSRYFFRKLELSYGVYISNKAEIGPGVDLPHPVGVVIGEGVVLGENVVIYQNVTIGGARRGDWQAGNYPTIGANSVIFSGAVLIGKIIIGKNSVIGANSVVTRDVPDDTTAVGALARLINRQ